MNTNDTFLAIFLGSKTSARMAAWNALSEEVRHAKTQGDSVEIMPVLPIPST
jgi:hypothetical protein